MNKNYSQKNFIQSAPAIDDPSAELNAYPTGYSHVWVSSAEFYDDCELEAYCLWNCIHVSKHVKPIPYCK